MKLQEELDNCRDELDKLYLQNNDLIDQLRSCQILIEGKASPELNLLITKKSILEMLKELNFDKKIIDLTEKIKQIETQLNGYARTGGNSPFPR